MVKQRDEPLDGAIRDAAEDPLAPGVVDLDLSRLKRLQPRRAGVDFFPQARLHVRALLDDARGECELEICRVLVDRVYPAVPDQEALQLCG